LLAGEQAMSGALAAAAVGMATDDAAGSSTVFIGEAQRRLEQLVLYMRALQLLASGLGLARTALADGRLSLSVLTRQGSLIDVCVATLQRDSLPPVL